MADSTAPEKRGKKATQNKPPVANAAEERIVSLPLAELHPFPNHISSTDSIPFFSEETAAWLPEANRRETDAQKMDSYRELIRENIEYDILLHDLPYDKDRLDEIVELMTETVCSKRKYIRIAGNDFPAESVKSRFLKIDAEHIKFVFDCLNANTSKVRNIKQYLLTVIYNAPTTIGNY